MFYKITFEKDDGTRISEQEIRRGKIPEIGTKIEATIHGATVRAVVTGITEYPPRTSGNVETVRAVTVRAVD